MREFSTGATRDVDDSKLDFEAFLSASVIERYAEYMHENRYQADGKMRDGDNWQKGIPKQAYMKSAWRHFFDVWKEHRGLKTEYGLEKSLCALLFNVMGYLHEVLKEKNAESEVRYTITEKGQDYLKQEAQVLADALASWPKPQDWIVVDGWEEKVHSHYHPLR